MVLACLTLFWSCSYDPEQLFDRDRAPIPPVLTMEGERNFIITENLPDFYYTIFSWSRANFGKGISAVYSLQVSDNEMFSGSVKTILIGEDICLKALSATELYHLAINDFGVYNSETEQIEPATLFFRISAFASRIDSFDIFYSNIESITCKWEEKEVWEPAELTLYFKVTSGDWGEYAVYAWGEAEVYGGWPGLKLESNAEGWYSFTVPTNRPINLIINNNGNGKQFDFLKDPTQDLAFTFEINESNNNCVWTEVDIPSAEPALYMIGDEFGGWNWSSDGIVTMAPVTGVDGHFWAVRYITAGKGFKWCAVRDWNGDFFTLGENIGYTTSGGNAFVSESGFYMIYVDMPNGKISVEPARVYGMGDCFGGWITSQYPFEVKDKTMTRTTVGSGELRLYAASNISPVGGDWWRMEFVIIDGKIAYRGNGGDQPRVPVGAGKLVTLDFNSGVGTIE